RCYELFKIQYPDTWQGIFLKFEESTQYTEARRTFGQWQQMFNRLTKWFTQSFAALSKAHGIEVAFIMAGSIVNQDASLGYAYTTPGAENFFVEHCHADTDTIIGHLKAHIYNWSSLACMAEMLDKGKSDIKGKAVEQNDAGHEQTTFPHKLSESHGQTWASGKLFPWKQLPQKLGQNALVCINWPDAVLFPGQECSSRSKPKGISDLTISECTQIVAAIRDTGPHRLHFKSAPNSKLDILTSKIPVIHGAPPLHDSKSLKAKRVFYDGKIDHEG
ncbi:hypothetical protein SCLCIDRAFT_90238, partial [Scleroderma citrinum Foug A]